MSKRRLGPRAGWLAALPLAMLMFPAAAEANGFPQPRGEGRVIGTLILSKSDKGFDDDGDVIDIPDYKQVQIYLNGEYGLTDDLTLLLTPSFRDVSVDAGGRDTSGLNFVELGGRYRVGQSGPATFSVQATARIPGKTYRDPIAQLNQDGMEYDVRAQVGVGLGQGGNAGFFIAEAGYRLRDDDPPNEVHADFTLGLRAAPKLLFLVNSFNTFSDGSGSGAFPSYRYHNVFASLVYDVTDRIAIQAGVQGTIAGENALRERGVVAGLWFRF